MRLCRLEHEGLFDSIPVEIEEASKIDGANDAQMIWRIVLPLAKPAIVVTCVMVLITVWNEYLFATTFLLNSDYYSLAAGLYQLQSNDYTRSWPLFTAAEYTRVDTAAADFLQDSKIHGLRPDRRRRERISMKKEAIFHRPMSEYAFGLDEDTTVFRLRCAPGDLERCTLWYGDTSSPETPVPVFPAEMTLKYRGENCDWWEVELRGTFHRLYYYFELTGEETLYYSGEVFFHPAQRGARGILQVPFQPPSGHCPRPPDWASDAVVYNIFPDSFASSRRAINGSGTEKCAGSALSRSRLGGTINGIRENLDYISEPRSQLYLSESHLRRRSISQVRHDRLPAH